MILSYIILILIVLSKLKIHSKDFNPNYMSHEMTNAIKGIFILLVFISHATPYITQSGYDYSGIGDFLFLFINRNVGQWVVAMFLFYSGYGVMESINKKGREYLASFPRKRILCVLANFDVAVLAFFLTNICLGKYFTPQEYLLSFIGWTSVGNSNWYIFVILLCYALTYIAFALPLTLNNKHKYTILVALCVVAAILLSFVKPYHWYDTILCYAMGMSYSIYQKTFVSFVHRRYVLSVGILSLILIGLFTKAYMAGGVSHNIFAMTFCLWVICISMKVSSNNNFLIWCGKNLFALYIYQRIPMIMLSAVGDGVLACSYPFLFISSCFVTTLLIAHLYKHWSIKL